MNKSDKMRFSQIMLGMADNFRDNITKEGMQMRWDMLQRYSLSQVEKAAKQILIARKFTRMPPIAEFIEAIDGEGPSGDKALITANEIIAHLRAHGAGVFPPTKDPVAKHLLTTRWPYYRWASEVLESELKWWVKEFSEAYNAFSKADLPLQISAPEEIRKLAAGIG